MKQKHSNSRRRWGNAERNIGINLFRDYLGIYSEEDFEDCGDDFYKMEQIGTRA